MSVSGPTFASAGVCFNITPSSCGGNQSFKLVYSGSSSVPDVSSCINQSSEGGCYWGCEDAVIGVVSSMSINQYTALSCAGSPVVGGLSNAKLVAVATSTGWEVWGYLFQTFNVVFFHATATVSPVKCSSVSLTFTNDVVIGQCYTLPCVTLGSQLGVGSATGGTAVLQFKKSCCP